MALLRMLLLLTLILSVYSVAIPDFSSICSRSLGDINLALMLDIAAPSPERFCLDSIKNGYWRSFVMDIEAFAYRLREINKRHDILPNVTIGYVAMETCFSQLAAAAQFENLVSDPTTSLNNTKGTIDAVPCRDISLDSDRIVGLSGPTTSDQAISVAILAGVYKFPMLSSFASTYELSDKGRYEYFSRLISPNTIEVEATLDFIQYHNWTYISFVYMEGAFGAGAAKTMLRSSKKRGICLAVYEMYSTSASEQDIKDIAIKLASRPTARVVVLYLYVAHITALFAALEAYPYYRPVWFGSNAVTTFDFGPSWHGAFTVGALHKPSPEFDKYLSTLKPSRNKDGNHWMPDLWEDILKCSWDEKPESVNCRDYENRRAPDTMIELYSSRYIESADAFAYAIHALITTKCPEVFRGTHTRSEIYSCVRGNQLLKYLIKTDIKGINGPIAFDKNGDRFSILSIYQFDYDNGVGEQRYSAAAGYDGKFSTLTVLDEKINWGIYDDDSKNMDRRKNSMNWTVYENTGSDSEVFGSVCSKPCKAKEYSVLQEERCCWECRTCRVNEKLNENRTDCELCQLLTWPDDDSATFCEHIPPTFTNFSDTLGLALLVVSLICTTLALLNIIWYIKNRKEKLIRASSRQLSAFILVGVILAYVNVIFFLIQPNTAICHIRISGFHISVTLIFGPLFVKTNRIYRIFSAGKKGVKTPSFIGNRILVLLTSALLLVQITMTIAVNIIVQSKPVYLQPVPTERFVELTCSLPLGVLLPGLVFNLSLLSMCGVYGYLTRKLPANFNESGYIFISVATTLFLWLVFIPAYFTAFYSSHQVLLLCCCLLFNATVTLICLFWPKIYALNVKDENELNVGTINTNSTAVDTS